MGTPSVTDPKARYSLLRMDPFQRRSFSERSELEESRKLDKVIVPSPLLGSSSSQKSVLVTTTPISEEANDVDHVTSDQVTTESRR